LVEDPIFQTALPGSLIVVTTYLTSRTDYYRVAAGITAFAFYGAALGAAVLSPASAASGLLVYLVVGVLVASIFLPIRITLLVGVVDILTLALLPLLDPAIPFRALVPALGFNLVITPLLIMHAWQRDLLERDRRAELLTINAQLADSVREAEEATTLAEDANRLKSEFLATMSHELRTPLNAIIGFAELLLMGLSGPLADDVLGQIERIRSNSRRLLALINDILDLAKIEARRVELVPRPFSVRHMASELSAQMGVLAAEKELTFTSTVHDDMPDGLIGDEELIRRMAINLLSNAFKFTSAGSVTLDIALTDSGDEWTLRVKDTGIGIPSHALAFIFDEFRQVDGSTRRAYGGTGLGLAIVRQYAQLMGGTVQVASALGEGSTFTITLPLVRAQEVAA
jgi:signal transduction histidine kinase